MDETPPLDPKEKPQRIGKFLDRPLIEIISVVFTLVVAFMVVVSGIAILIYKIINPDANTTDLLGIIGNILTTMTAALLGLIAGQNGSKKDSP